MLLKAILFVAAMNLTSVGFADEAPNIEGSWQVTKAKNREKLLDLKPGEMLTQFSKGTYTSSVSGKLSMMGLSGAKGTFKQNGFDLEVTVDGAAKIELGKVVEATKDRLVIENKDLELELIMARITDEEFKKLSAIHAAEIAKLPKK